MLFVVGACRIACGKGRYVKLHAFLPWIISWCSFQGTAGCGTNFTRMMQQILATGACGVRQNHWWAVLRQKCGAKSLEVALLDAYE